MIDAVDIDLFDAVDVDLPDIPGISARTGFTMRPYQEQAVDAFWLGLAPAAEAPLGYRRQIIVLPTGCGKTIVFAEIVRGAVARGWKVLILAHSDELLDQAADKLLRSTGIDSEKEKAEHVASSEAMVVVGSVQTLRRPDRLAGWDPEHFKLVIIDECHRALAKSYQDILAHFKSALVLGVTATPDRGDKRNLGQFFNRIAFSYSLLDAVIDGWLVRPVARQIPLQIDVRGIRTSRTSEGSDFNLTEVAERLEPIISEIARMVTLETLKRGQGIVFLPSIATARMMAKALKECGVSAVAIAGEDNDREKKRDAFLRGEYKVLCNAMLFTEGFDYDRIDWVCPLRLTKILSLYRQMVGRGTRPLSGMVDRFDSAAARKEAIASSAKPNLLILDFLWKADKMALVGPAHLVTDSDDVAKKMVVREGVDVDLLEEKAVAERDLLASIEKAARENKTKTKRTIDPLTFAVSVHAEAIAEYQPSARWEKDPPTSGQIARLQEDGFDVTKITCRGHASMVIEKLNERKELGLCTAKQMKFLTDQGHPDPEFVRFEDAQRIVKNKMIEWGKKRAEKQLEQAQNTIRASIRGIFGCADEIGTVQWLVSLQDAWGKTPQLFPTGWPAVVNMLANHTNPAVRLALTPFLLDRAS